MSDDIIIAVIGASEASKELVEANLADLRDKAAVGGDAFWGIVCLTSDSPEAAGFAIDWFVENEIAYDLVLASDIASQVPEEYTSGADKTFKSKEADNKAVDHLMANGGSHLLVLLGDEDPSESVQKAAQKAFDAGIVVLDLADANLPVISFGEPDTVDADSGEGGEEEGPDFLALGEAADGGDDEAIAQLCALGEEHGVDVAEYADNSWTEFAEAIMDVVGNAESESAEDTLPEKPAAKTTKASAAKTAAAAKGATKWTQEELDALDVKDLRSIAEQSGVENSRKSGVAALKTALLGKAKPADADEAPAEEEPKAAAKTPAKKPAAKTPAPADDDAVGAAIEAIHTGLLALAAALSAR